ncbi:hypothetical protein [Paenibacillus sp. 1781tsa1]|uniref:hypothetical protein n=1 Tax=Paenibacillus sp. 1781tsa1 TaxID=2953810 RepID=UPI00209EA84B|nr:hypothetical protein [Paenibacillus sp. 1781tsa1]MCP1182624.1 hypothetical protein [Paenibacillus sp. 1781tsa1]
MEKVYNFVRSHFNIGFDEFINKETIVWDHRASTILEPFVEKMFGDVIQKGLDDENSFEDIVKEMIIRSIIENYGLTEYIVRFTKIDFNHYSMVM